jgi:hypothetical protein
MKIQNVNGQAKLVQAEFGVKYALKMVMEMIVLAELLREIVKANSHSFKSPLNIKS